MYHSMLPCWPSLNRVASCCVLLYQYAVYRGKDVARFELLLLCGA